MAGLNRGFTIDTGLEMEDGAAAITSTEVNSGGIVDLGSGVFEGTLVIQNTAIAVDGGDEAYLIELELSSSASFASDIIVGAKLHLGCDSVIGESADTAVGVYQVPFHNDRLGTPYRYARLAVTNAGATSSITYTAYIVPR
jgi:hypothetical protein